MNGNFWTSRPRLPFNEPLLKTPVFYGFLPDIRIYFSTVIIRTIITFTAILLAATALQAGVEQIVVGDSIKKATNQLGTPVLEYPLNGQMIHKYEECTLISSNEVIVSVEYHVPIDILEEKAANEGPPTIDEIKEQAMQNDAAAQYLLAYCFQFGKLVEQDYGKAVNWYTLSAKQGHMPAQHNLGYLYLNGTGVEQDYEQAYVWALLAAQNGNDALLKALKYRISDEQKQAAFLRAEQIRSLMQAEKPEQ